MDKRSGLSEVKGLTGRWRDGALALAAVGVFLLLWEVTFTFIISNPVLFPNFSSTFETFLFMMNMRDPISKELIIPGDILSSFLDYGIGLAIGLGLGIPLGILMGWFRTFEKAIYPLIELMRSIPPLAWLPAAILWVGFTPQAAGLIIAIGCFFPTLLNTYSGVRGVDKTLVDTARTLGVKSPLQMIWKVVLPHSLPSIFTGVRIAFGVGWMFVVAGELFMTSGLGYRLINFFYWGNLRLIFSLMFLIGLIGLLIDIAFRRIEAVALKWRRGITA